MSPKPEQSSKEITVKGNRIGRAAALLLAFCFVAMGLWWRTDTIQNVTRSDVPDDPEAILAAAMDFYSSRPYYERPRPYSPVPEGLPDMNSRTCGSCHREIYWEWALSTHRRAWLDDAQFMEELAKSRGDYAKPGEEKQDVSWMCVNCHTPMMNQLENLVIDLKDGDIGKPVYAKNPYFNPTMQLDAIGCATCHVQDGIIYGPRGDTNAPHPTAKGEHLLTEQACTTCHQAEAHYPEQNLACFFSTGKEWESSKFAENGQTCQDCHMPKVTRKVAEAFDVPERETRHHWFGGSLIPKHPDFEEELKHLLPIFGSGAKISVEDIQNDNYVVRVHNKYAGHLFPTGDPERHVDVEVIHRSHDREVILQTTQRIGMEIEWWPETKIISDNRIKPGETLDLLFRAPAERRPSTVEVVATKYRMHKEAFDYHKLEGRYVRGREFHRSTWHIAEDGTITLQSIKDDWGERDTLEPEVANLPPLK